MFTLGFRSLVVGNKKGIIMAGTRTAPNVTGAATSAMASLHLIDASGDQWSEAVPSADVPTVGDVETLAGTYQPMTQASIWKITLTQTWEGDADPDNAEALYRGHIESGINLLWKNIATLDTQSPRLVAPVAAALQGNQDIPLLTGTGFPALIAAYQLLLAGYDLTSAQYTGRRERKNNPRIKA